MESFHSHSLPLRRVVIRVLFALFYLLVHARRLRDVRVFLAAMAILLGVWAASSVAYVIARLASRDNEDDDRFFSLFSLFCFLAFFLR